MSTVDRLMVMLLVVGSIWFAYCLHLSSQTVQVSPGLLMTCVDRVCTISIDTTAKAGIDTGWLDQYLTDRERRKAR